MALLLLAATCSASPAALKDYSWGLGGCLLSGADSVQVLVAVRNDTSISAFSIDLHYDTTLLEITEPLLDNLALEGRAADLELFASRLADWSFVRLTVFSTVSAAPFPELEPGDGVILRLSFRVKKALGQGEFSTLLLKLKNGTPLTSSRLGACGNTGAQGEIKGYAKIGIFNGLPGKDARSFFARSLASCLPAISPPDLSVCLIL